MNAHGSIRPASLLAALLMYPMLVHSEADNADHPCRPYMEEVRAAIHQHYNASDIEMAAEGECRAGLALHESSYLADFAFEGCDAAHHAVLARVLIQAQPYPIPEAGDGECDADEFRRLTITFGAT